MAAPTASLDLSRAVAHLSTGAMGLRPMPQSPGASSTSSLLSIELQRSDRTTPPSPDDATQLDFDRRGPTATMRLSLLLNPSDEEEHGKKSKNQVAKVPKKRGRKPILPKMSNSERGKYYRAKRTEYSSVLKQDVEALRATVERLVALRNISSELAVCPRTLTSGSLVKLVREYFVQFRNGVQLPPSRRNLELQDVETSTATQEVFVSAVMDPDVSFGEFKGIGVVMDQWTRYSKFHALLRFELQDVRVFENEDDHVVETSALLRSRYSRTTIENVFPHVVGNEFLIQRLIGKEVVYPCRNQFYFTQDGRVQRYDVEADFPKALQNALGSLQDVATLLGEALIRQQHMMGELESDELAVIEQIERRAIGGSDEVPRGGDSPPSSRIMDVDFLLSDGCTAVV